MVQKPPTVRDVARRAGVSVATVSRVMNNKGYLGAEIKKQVQKAMDDLGYVPNQIARSFYKKRTNTIGVVIPGETIMVSKFSIVERLGLLNTRLAVILPTLSAPLFIYMFRQFFKAVSDELLEAAKIEGHRTLGFFGISCFPCPSLLLQR